MVPPPVSGRAFDSIMMFGNKDLDLGHTKDRSAGACLIKRDDWVVNLCQLDKHRADSSNLSRFVQLICDRNCQP
jgi:hypothetical protein